MIAVLNDLVSGGLLYATGRGRGAAYGATTHSDQATMLRERSLETLTHLVWLALAEAPGKTRAELELQFADGRELLEEALAQLVADGRARRQEDAGEERFFSPQVLIPIGSEAGWETAVFDHYRAVCAALVNKMRQGGASAAAKELIGGTTLSFDLYPGHPYEAQVKGLLTKVRGEALELWRQVAAYNAAHPVAEDSAEKVIFYAGQNFISNDQSKEQP